MKIISHRGNLNGSEPTFENRMNVIDNALNMGFGVEIDLWYMSDQWFLGHDVPERSVSLDQIKIWSKKNDLYCHCKNIQSLEKLISEEKAENTIPFFHDRDQCILLRNNKIWVHPNAVHLCVDVENSIAVLPNCKSLSNGDLTLNGFYAICTDYAETLRNTL